MSEFLKEINKKYNFLGEWWGYSKKTDNLNYNYYHFYSWTTNTTNISFKRVRKRNKGLVKTEYIKKFAIAKECTYKTKISGPQSPVLLAPFPPHPPLSTMKINFVLTLPKYI